MDPDRSSKKRQGVLLCVSKSSFNYGEIVEGE